MTELLNGQKRSCYCGDLNKDYVGQKITLMGWVHRRRDLGNLIFVQIRDRMGISQVVLTLMLCP